MIIVRQDEGEIFVPDHHEKMSARKVFGPENGSSKAVIHISNIQPGGGMEEEVHEGSDQVFYVLSGSITAISNGQTIAQLDPGDGLHVKAGDPHAFRNHGSESCILHIVTVPPIG